MNKIVSFLTLMCFLVFSGQLAAQDYVKTVKKAKRALSNYYLDEASNGDDLDEAKDLIMDAFKDDAANSDYNALLIKGRTLSAYVARAQAASLIDPTKMVKTWDLSSDAKNALVSALGIAEKKYQKEEVLDNLAFHAVNLSNEGINAFKTEDFGLAYNALSSTLEVKKLLDDNGLGNLYLGSDDEMNSQMYYTALAAQLANKNDKAVDIYNSLLERGYNSSDIYEGLYRASYDTDKEKAVGYLEEGRKMYPDSTNLLFAEINHYLKEGQITSLEDKLKEGIDKDPKNASLHMTLGNVYDRLYQKSFEGGKKDEAQSYFDKAIAKYKDALDIDANMGDALYSVGALYFNKAANVSQELNALADDFSNAGMKKYEAKNKEMLSYFDSALPWFKKSEMANANDINTLIALKEIFAKKEEVSLSNEFKTRLEKVRAGETLKSYFEGK